MKKSFSLCNFFLFETLSMRECFMKMKEENKKMDIFDEKIAQVFQDTLPEMPDLPGETDEVQGILELNREELDQLQAAGETMAGDIVRFLKHKP